MDACHWELAAQLAHICSVLCTHKVLCEELSTLCTQGDTEIQTKHRLEPACSGSLVKCGEKGWRWNE